MPYCRHCGIKLDDSSIFCAKCGTPVKKSDAKSEPTNAEQPVKSIVNKSHQPESSKISVEPQKQNKQRHKGLVVTVIVLAVSMFLVLSLVIVFWLREKGIIGSDNKQLSAEIELSSDENSKEYANTSASSTTTEIVSQLSTSEYYFEFPSWYELDKVVVYENMVCEARRNYWYSEDTGMLPFVWLYVFDDDGHMTKYKGWLLCDDEKSAQDIFNEYYLDRRDNAYVEKNTISVTYDVSIVSFYVIAEIKGYSSIDEISMQDIIDFCDGGTLWGKEPKREVVYLSSDTDSENIQEEENNTWFQDGNYIVFGSYEQDGDTSNGPEPIEWEIVKKEDDRMLLVSRYILDCQPYNTELADFMTWENCSLRSWLNDNFINMAFSESEQNQICTVINVNQDNDIYGIKGGNDTEDKVFCLSVEEILDNYDFDDWIEEEYGPYGYSQNLMTEPTQYAQDLGAYYSHITNEIYTEVFQPHGYTEGVIGLGGCHWWLRTAINPVNANNTLSYRSACCVSWNGCAGWGMWSPINNANGNVGVRPAIYLSV